MNAYFELYKHPLWQKKRLKILELNNFECESCGDSETTLEIHHSYYEKGLKPWEYDDSTLYCLCTNCHIQEQKIEAKLKKTLALMPLNSRETVLGYVQALIADDCPVYTFILLSYEHALGVANYCGINVDNLISQCSSDGKVDGFFLTTLIKK